jgi:hypothetical protein
MRFLLDMPVSTILIDILNSFGHEGIHAYDIGYAGQAALCPLEVFPSAPADQ